MLARVKKGPVASVPEATCTADPGADALQLDNPEKASMTDAMLGKWVQIGGRLEKETSKDPDNLRELDVLTLKMVPVVPPRPAAAPAAAAPPAMAEPRPAPAAAAPAAPTRLPLHRHPQSPRSFRRPPARFRRSDGPGCSRSQQASVFVRSGCGSSKVEVVVTDTDPGRNSSHAAAPFVAY